LLLLKAVDKPAGGLLLPDRIIRPVFPYLQTKYITKNDETFNGFEDAILK
jgi:hypothetical protein